MHKPSLSKLRARARTASAAPAAAIAAAPALQYGAASPCMPWLTEPGPARTPKALTAPADGARRWWKSTDFATVAFATSGFCVNACAFIGQYGFAVDHFGMGRGAAGLYAVTIESIATTVSAYADRAQRNNDSALRIKLASYLIGAGVGALNYWHFAGAHFTPTPKAIAFGFLSAAAPWLWSLFSRRQSRDILLAKGLIEGRSVRLGATRWMLHPVLSFKVARFASLFGIRDPKAAMLGYAGYRQRTGKPLKAFEGLQAELELDSIQTASAELEPELAGGQNWNPAAVAPELEPGAPQNQNRDGVTPELEPELDVARDQNPAVAGSELEPVPAGTGLAGATAEPEPVSEPAVQVAAVPGPGSSGNRVVRMLHPPRPNLEELRRIALPIMAGHWAEHGTHITAQELQRRLRVSKTVTCEVMRPLRDQVERDAASAAGDGPGTAPDPAPAGAVN